MEEFVASYVRGEQGGRGGSAPAAAHKHKTSTSGRGVMKGMGKMLGLRASTKKRWSEGVIVGTYMYRRTWLRTFLMG